MIVVADDEPVVTFMIAQKLSALGACVVTASNGAEALRLATEHLPCVVVTDFEMPRMNGLQFAQALHAQAATAAIPVIMLTARGHRVPPGEMAKTQIQHLLAKPFSARELTELVAELLASEVARRGVRTAA
ncbi:N/A [soil metagenome]